MRWPSWWAGCRAAKVRVVYLVHQYADGHRVFCQPYLSFVLEHKVNPYGDGLLSALWWAFMDVTTVGARFMPSLPTGKILSVVLAAPNDVPMFPIFTVYVTSLVQQANKRKEEYYQSQQSEPADTK